MRQPPRIEPGERAAADAAPSRWRAALSDERIADLIKTAFRQTSRALQTRLGERSMQYGHWTLLRVLWQTDGLTQRELSERAGVTEPSTFIALRRMEQLGYVKRGRMAGNNRQLCVSLTSKGAALRAFSVSAAEEVNRVALAGIAADDVAATRRALLAMIDNLESDARRAASRNGNSGTARRVRASASGTARR